VGSTVKTLNERFSLHKCDKTCSSNEILKYGNAVIELLEEIKFDDRKELLWKERHYQDQFENISVNKIRSITTKSEKMEIKKRWNEINREYIKIKKREWDSKKKLK
jgi:hypothetical protein